MNLGTAALHYFGKELYNSHFAEIPDVKILLKNSDAFRHRYSSFLDKILVDDGISI